MPVVSIILPTYNRAAFLPEAFAAIRSQSYPEWELIVVDDGSTDGTNVVLQQLIADTRQSVRCIGQTNQGAYAARNSGLDHARGRYIAFYDSDDKWLPHHLANCVGALEAHADVDWVFSACRRVDFDNNQVLLDNTFYYADGNPWPFLQLGSRVDDRLRILDDSKTLACMIAAGLNCGLQTSVIRRKLFDAYRFQTRFRNEAEDQMTVIWALWRGFRMAYFDDVHVEYRVHVGNSSATGPQAVEKRLAVLDGEARGYADIPERGIQLSHAEERARRRRLVRQYFWEIGYATLWQNGRRQEAMKSFRRGLSYWPWSLACWKTYFLSAIRSARMPRTSSER